MSRFRRIRSDAGRRAATCCAAALAALGVALAPSTAFAAEGDNAIEGRTYREVIFDHALKPYDSEQWVAECPASFPFLSTARSSNDEHVGFGLHITQESPAALHMVDEGFWSKWFVQIDGETQAITRNNGTVTNWWPSRQHLRVEMVCTSELAEAWTRPTILEWFPRS